MLNPGFENLSADQTQDESAKRVFLSIAQVEKSHMQMLANAIELCPGTTEKFSNA